MVEFNGTPIITADEGVFLPPTLGIMQRTWQFKRLVRVDGEIAFDRGRAGCDHVVTVRFLDVAVGMVDDIWNRMDALQATPMEGDLVIGDMPVMGNCVCTGVEPTPATLTVRSMSLAGQLALTRGYNMEFTCTFRQLR